MDDKVLVTYDKDSLKPVLELDLAKKIGERIRGIRLRQPKEHQSAHAFAESIGVSKSTINNWETGKTSPSLAELLSICQQYKVHTAYLLGDIDWPNQALQDCYNNSFLSKDALKKLWLLKIYDHSDWLETLSNLITDDRFDDFIDWFTILIGVYKNKKSPRTDLRSFTYSLELLESITKGIAKKERAKSTGRR